MPVIELQPYRAASDRARVQRLFEEDTFYFKTHIPALAAPEEIDVLLSTDTRLIEVDAALVGLAETEVCGLEFATHYRLHIAFSSSTPLALRRVAFAHAVRDLKSRRIVSRLTYQCYAFDELGLALARSAELQYEGAFGRVIRLYGKTYDTLVFATLLPSCEATPLPPESPWPSVVQLPQVAAPLRALRSGRHSFSGGSWPVGELISCARDPQIAELRLASFAPEELQPTADRRCLVLDDRLLVYFSNVHVVHRTAQLQICAPGDWEPFLLSRALQAAAAYAFGVYNLHKVYGFVTETQNAARSLLASAGFARELTIPQAMAAHGRFLARDIWSKVNDG